MRPGLYGAPLDRRRFIRAGRQAPPWYSRRPDQVGRDVTGRGACRHPDGAARFMKAPCGFRRRDRSPPLGPSAPGRGRPALLPIPVAGAWRHDATDVSPRSDPLCCTAWRRALQEDRADHFRRRGLSRDRAGAIPDEAIVPRPRLPTHARHWRSCSNRAIRLGLGAPYGFGVFVKKSNMASVSSGLRGAGRTFSVGRCRPDQACPLPWTSRAGRASWPWPSE